VIEFFLTQLTQNNVLSGLIGGSLFASLLFMLRKAPGAVWDALVWRFTCSVTVLSEDESYERVDDWLASLEYSKRCRDMRLAGRNEKRGGNIVVPGIGKHLVWIDGRPVIVDRYIPANSGSVSTWKRFENLKFTTIGASPTRLRSMLATIAGYRPSTDSVEVCMFRERGWRTVCRKPKRSLSTVHLPSGQKESILRDINRFLSSQEWYAERGIPFRRGYLFEGPPGCGKTTLALALASHFERPIHALNLGSLQSDDELIEAVSDVPPEAILLIEDIDAAQIGTRAAKQKTEGAEKKDEERSVTLSGLLNVLDGVFARDGRILIMTTNYPERVDSALLRPGRADRREHIGLLDSDAARDMAIKFFANEDEGEAFMRHVKTPIAPAELQERMLRERSVLRRVA
jgi:hypothetical protein